MVKIFRCRECGNRTAEIWKEHQRCIECGGPVEHLDVDMGFAERVPRVLNIGGAAFAIIAFLYLMYKLIAGDLGRQEGTTTMILFLVGIVFLASSLIFLMQLSSKAKVRSETMVSGRKQRRVREGPQREDVRSGKVGPPVRRTASKLPLKKR